VSYARSCGFRF